MFTQSSRRLDLARLIKFALVGLVNTCVGYTAILSALALGCGDIAANVIGYAIGLSVSFVLNNRWTFAAAGRPDAARVGRYILTFAVAYAANLAIILIAASHGLAHNPCVHLAGLCIYTVLFYLGSRYVVFANRAVVESTTTASR